MITSIEESLTKLTTKCSEELEKGTHPFFTRQLLSFFSDQDLKNLLPVIQEEISERDLSDIFDTFEKKEHEQALRSSDGKLI